MKPSFVYVTHIQSTPEKVWEAITNSEFIRQYWFGRTKRSTWTEGAKLESFSPENELEFHGTIVTSEPPHKLVYTFEVVGSGEPASRVTFDIQPNGPDGKGGCKAVSLTVTHDEFPSDSKVLKGISKGWPQILSGLKTLLETGRPLDLAHTPCGEE